MNFIDRKNSWRGRSFGISLLALTLTSFYLLLPFLTKSKTLSEESEELSSSRISIHPNHHLLLTFGKHLFITINITLRYLFDFLFLFGLFSELFISLDYLWKRSNFSFQNFSIATKYRTDYLTVECVYCECIQMLLQKKELHAMNSTISN